MTRRATPPTPKPAVVLPLAAALAAALAAGPAVGQYKWIGPDGKVNYGDQPPPEATEARPVATAPLGGGGASLPWSLQQAVAKYPVTLYTGAECAPCDTARKHLQARGIPYAEKQLSKPADVEAFKALGFAEPSLPAITVGRQRMAGFEAGTWNGLLDAAGYPAQSMLPKGWKPAPAQPLVATAPLPLPEPKAAGDAAAAQRRPTEGDSRIGAPSIAMPPAPERGAIRF